MTVLMACFNSELTVESAVESILAQTYSNFELMIIDDGSTDGTVEIIKRYCEQDQRVKLIKNYVNIGLAASLNKGVDLSSGSLIARMDSDDVLDSERLIKQVAVFSNYPDTEVVYTGVRLIDKDGLYVCDAWKPKDNETILNNLEKFNFICHPSVMFRKDTVEKVKGYNSKLKTAEDLDLWLRLRSVGARFYYLDEKLIYYRINPKSMRLGAASDQKDYYARLSNLCLLYGQKCRALKYFRRMRFRSIVWVSLKFLLPWRFYFKPKMISHGCSD